MIRIASTVFACCCVLSRFAPAQQPYVELDHCVVSLIEDVRLPAEASGLLVELTVTEGDHVEKGELLGRLDDADAQLQRKAAELKYEVAKEDATNDVNVRYAKAAAAVADADVKAAEFANRRSPGSFAETELNKLRLAYKRASLQIEVAELEYKKADLNARVAQADVEAADQEIKRRKLDAPISGEVEQVFKHVGEWVNAGETVARIVWMDRLRVQGFVAATDQPDGRKGRLPAELQGKPIVVIVELPGDVPETLRTFRGTLEFVSNLVESSGDYRVWAEVDNRKIARRGGRWVEVDAREDAADAHWVLRPGLTATMRVALD